MFAIETRDEIDNVNEVRLCRIEECIAARWPRRWTLWARLRREIRASVATFDDDYIPRNNFYGRRVEWSMQQSSAARARRKANRAANLYGNGDDRARAARLATDANHPAGSALPRPENDDPGKRFLP